MGAVEEKRCTWARSHLFVPPPAAYVYNIIQGMHCGALYAYSVSRVPVALRCSGPFVDNNNNIVSSDGGAGQDRVEEEK